MNLVAVFDMLSEPIAKRVTAGLARIGQVLRTQAWKGAAAAGVTPTQASALTLIHDAPDGIRLNTVSSRLGVSSPTASDAVNSLVAKGLVVKSAGEDRRALNLRLTPQGEEIAKHTREWPAFLDAAVDTLAEDEKADFLKSLIKIVRALQVAEQIPQQQMCVTCAYFRPNIYPGTPDPHHCAYVDAPFGDRHLRLNCAEQVAATAEEQHRLWEIFSQ